MDPKALAALGELLGDRVRTSLETSICYSYDATGKKFLPDAVAFPVDAEEVRRIVLLANRHRFPVVPRGAGSGFSGGSLPVHGEMAWQRFGQALGVLRDLVQADGADLLLVQATTYGPDMSSRLARLCTTLEVARVDLVPILGRSGQPLTYVIDGHWRAAGHRLAAASLAPVVCDRLAGVEPPPPPAR